MIHEYYSITCFNQDDELIHHPGVSSFDLSRGYNFESAVMRARELLGAFDGDGRINSVLIDYVQLDTSKTIAAETRHQMAEMTIMST